MSSWTLNVAPPADSPSLRRGASLRSRACRPLLRACGRTGRKPIGWVRDCRRPGRSVRVGFFPFKKGKCRPIFPGVEKCSWRRFRGSRTRLQEQTGKILSNHGLRRICRFFACISLPKKGEMLAICFLARKKFLETASSHLGAVPRNSAEKSIGVQARELLCEFFGAPLL